MEVIEDLGQEADPYLGLNSVYLPWKLLPSVNGVVKESDGDRAIFKLSPDGRGVDGQRELQAEIQVVDGPGISLL